MSTVRIREIAQVNPGVPDFESQPADTAVTFVPLEAVWPGEQLDLSRTRPLGEVSTGYARFAEGDILVPKVAPTFQAARAALAMGVPCRIGAASTEVHVVRPRAGTEPRYLTYAFHTKTFLDEGVSTFQGVAGLQRVPDLFIRDFRIRRRDLEAQRQIADFLDNQVARIDEIIRLREEQVGALSERNGLLADELVAEASANGWVRLKYASKLVTVGIVITPSAWYADDGIPALRGTNVKPDLITLDDLVYLTKEGHALHGKSHLKAGDVVVVRTGQAGAAAVVPPELEGANAIDLLIVRPRAESVPEFLAMVLNSPTIRERTATSVVGAIQGHFNVATLAEAQVPAASHATQQTIARQWRTESARVREAQAEMSAQIELLKEKKRSLITAAVTGEFDVTTASGRGVA